MKHSSGVTAYWPLFSGLMIFAAFLLGSASIPSTALADEIRTQTIQVLPPGGTTCAPVSAMSFTPYIYDGALHSFDFTMPDASYVALIGTVGEQSVPFHHMTRRIDAAGMLRVHVDINSVPLTGTLPITVTLLSAKGSGQPVCAAVVNILVGSGPIQQPGTPAPSAPATNVPSSGSTNEPTDSETVPVPTPPTPTVPTPTATTATSSGLGTLCSTQSSAIGLWIILLVFYAVLVAALLWANWPTSWAWVRTPEWLTAGMLVPLILLLAFWYAVASCRGAWWLPVVAVAIAIVGLFTAFWNHPRVQQLLLPEQKKS